MKQERARDGRCGWERGEGREGRGDLTVIIIISIIIIVTTTTTTNIVYIAHNMTYDLLAIGHGGGMKKREKRRRGGDLQPSGSGGLYLHIGSIGGITHCVSLPLAPHPRSLPPITILQRALTGQYIHSGLIDESIV